MDFIQTEPFIFKNIYEFKIYMYFPVFIYLNMKKALP